jgi:hypothetical protein
MTKTTTSLLQLLTMGIGFVVLALLLWEPHLEGRNVGNTVFEIYFTDLFLAYVYAGSIPFFVGLYQVIKVLGYVGQGKAYSHEVVRALSIMRLCALATAGAVCAAIIYLLIHARLYPEVNAVDGPEGAVVLGALATLASVGVAAIIGVTQKKLQRSL